MKKTNTVERNKENFIKAASAYINRRRFIQTGALAGAGALVLSQTACAKNLSVYEQTIIAAFEEVVALFPSAGPAATKIKKLIADFDAAYRAGDFKNATTLIASVASLASQVIADIGINLTSGLKGALALAGIAIRFISKLLVDQGNAQPQVMAEAAKATGAMADAVATIKRLADPDVLNMAFAAVRF